MITGATAGVGRAVARIFASRGAVIGLIARGRRGLEATAREVTELGGRALVLPTDVADDEQVRHSRDVVLAEAGRIDLWINNAMASVFSPANEVTAEEFRRVTEVTYLGVVHGTLAALDDMLPRDNGVIVQVGSALCFRSLPLQAAYCAAKHAVKGFTEALRCDLIHDHRHVRVTMVHLPALNTPQFRWVRSRLRRKAQPVPPIYQPEVAARAIAWAADHAKRRAFYVGWPTVASIQINKFVPGFFDRYLARRAYAAQQTVEFEDPGRPDNLWKPVEGDFGAHGDFDRRAGTSAPLFWLTSRASFAGSTNDGPRKAGTCTRRRARELSDGAR